MMNPPLRNSDRHGLATLGRSWAPKGMRRTEVEELFWSALCDCTAEALNILEDAADYLPIILNPSRCLDEDIGAILSMNGIDRDTTVDDQQARRLAIIAQALRSWRGAFLAHRSLVGALTGHSALIRTWFTRRFVLDRSTYELTLVIDANRNMTQIFVIASGNDEDATYSYSEAQLQKYLASQAKPILDDTEMIPCYTITTWRDGYGEWEEYGEPELIAGGLPNEYEAIDIGPAVNPLTGDWRIKSPIRKSSLGITTFVWVTVWFKTGMATDDSYWEVELLSSNNVPRWRGYVARVHVGNHQVEILKIVNGAYLSIGIWNRNIPDGLSGPYHRLDFIANRLQVSTQTRLRVYVDHDPSPWFSDTGWATRPTGSGTRITLSPANFTTGRLRIAAITGQERP